jgi:hypothetical protein
MAILVDALPADDGDCLLVQWEHRGRTHRMLIDGGRRLPALAGKRFDLVVCTHVDRDHIGGLLALLATPGFHADDVWFNGPPQLEAYRSYPDGDALAALLSSRPWNAAFGGDAVVVPPRGSLRQIEKHGMRFTLLSPTSDRLTMLAEAWRGPYQPDRSVTNGSSIAFIAEHIDGGRVLFGADAHAEVLEQSLRRIARERPYQVDLCKVPHHGSRHNTSPSLLAALDCHDWLFCTNGKNGNPRQETLDRIEARPGKHKLWFNYRPGRAGLRLSVTTGSVREHDLE